MPERTARELAEHRATHRATIEPCRCGRTGWYRFPGDVARCTECGSPLKVTWALGAAGPKPAEGEAR